MRRTVFWLALLPLGAWAQTTGAPSYSAAGLVNAATALPGNLAPNSLAILNGTNLAWTTMSASLTPGEQLPQRMAGAGVQVLLAGGTPAYLVKVSPTQVEFLVPYSRLPGDTTLTLVRDGVAGPGIPASVTDVAPGIFQTDSLAAATHADGSPINHDAPARPGEVIVIYCTGLGPAVVPRDSSDDGRVLPLEVDLATVRMARYDELAVTLNDAAVDPQSIQWAGLTPGSVGLYQVNLQLPGNLDPDPEVKIWVAGAGSPSGVRLAVKP